MRSALRIIVDKSRIRPDKLNDPSQDEESGDHFASYSLSGHC
jgi:hypothetical protein